MTIVALITTPPENIGILESRKPQISTKMTEINHITLHYYWVSWNSLAAKTDTTNLKGLIFHQIKINRVRGSGCFCYRERRVWHEALGKDYQDNETLVWVV